MKRRADHGGSLGAGPANRPMVIIAVLAPGAEHHITGPQVTGDELSQLKLAPGQGVVGKAAANPLQAVHR
ncbi:hypothetical protein D3C86_1270310 [compost metagenome]